MASSCQSSYDPFSYIQRKGGSSKPLNLRSEGDRPHCVAKRASFQCRSSNVGKYASVKRVGHAGSFSSPCKGGPRRKAASHKGRGSENHSPRSSADSYLRQWVRLILIWEKRVRRRNSQLRSSVVRLCRCAYGFDFRRAKLRYFPRGLLQCHLHLGDGWHRHPGRQHVRSLHYHRAHSHGPAHNHPASGNERSPAQWPTISQQCGRSTAR